MSLLQQQKDILFAKLMTQTISGQFAEKYKSFTDGSTTFIDGVDEEFINQIRNYSKDKTKDNLYHKKVMSVNSLNSQAIIAGFISDMTNLLTYISDNKFEFLIQALFIEYDDYDYKKGIISGLGKQEYPVVQIPRYIRSEIDFSKVVFDSFDGINFEAAWPDCEDFEWTTICLELYYDLLKLFQLNSRILLHTALSNLEDRGAFNILTTRPVTVYVFEHDCEVMTLYGLN